MKEIILKNSDKVALIDDADYAAVSQFSWILDKITGYAYRNLPYNGQNTRRQYLHQYLLGEKPGHGIDHKDGNRLNDQCENLRHATRSQNNANRRKQAGASSSRFKGVSLYKATGQWRAAIKINKRSVYLGLFITEKDAAVAYDCAASTAFGEFACLNFP